MKVILIILLILQQTPFHNSCSFTPPSSPIIYFSGVNSSVSVYIDGNFNGSYTLLDFKQEVFLLQLLIILS